MFIYTISDVVGLVVLGIIILPFILIGILILVGLLCDWVNNKYNKIKQVIKSWRNNND